MKTVSAVLGGGLMTIKYFVVILIDIEKKKDRIHFAASLMYFCERSSM